MRVHIKVRKRVRDLLAINRLGWYESVTLMGV
jgi:hypothetical protein